MKWFTLKIFLVNIVYFFLLCFLIFTVIIRISNNEIFYIKFSLIPIIYKYKLFWVWQLNNIITIAIFIFIVFKNNNIVWGYIILEKIIYLNYFYFQSCQSGKCISCDYNGTLSFLNNSTIIVLNLFIIFSATILFFSSYTSLYNLLLKLSVKKIN